MGNCQSLSDFENNSVSQRATRQTEVDDLALFTLPSKGKLTMKASLIISCDNLKKSDIMSKSDPFVVVYEVKDNKYVEIGRTEVIVNNQSPQFVKHIHVLYHFETVQNMVFKVYDADENAPDSEHLRLENQDFLGQAECTLASLITSKGKTMNLTGLPSNQGTISIHYEEIKESKGKIDFSVNIKSLDPHRARTCDPFYILSRQKNGQPVMIYRSEVHRNTTTPTFTTTSIDTFTLCNNDYTTNLTLEIYDYVRNGSHVHLGRCSFTVEDILNDNFESYIMSSRNQPTGSLVIKKTAVKEMPTFLSCLNHGLELNFMVAIDFTASNGDPRDSFSLHYIYPRNSNKLNSYERAILSIGTVLECYDKDKLFPVYGFGGIPSGFGSDGDAFHCFPLNGNYDNPNVYGINGVLDVYRRAIHNTTLSGPTYFNEVLNKAASEARECQKDTNKYLVLLIITDGCIHDMDETIKTIVDNSDLPLSIIIVGVGDEDFTYMEILDGDQQRLHYNKVVAKRDIVQFLPIEELKDKSQLNITKELLQEIPEQVCSYMELNNITLDDIQKASVGSQPSNAIPTAIPVDAIPTAAPLEAIPTAAPLNAIPTATPLNAIPTAAPLEAIPTAAPLDAIPSTTPLNAIPTATPLNTNVSSH